MSIFKRNKSEEASVRRIVISPSAKGMYLSALDQLSFYRNSPRLANLVSPAFITAREFCCDIYEEIQKER